MWKKVRGSLDLNTFFFVHLTMGVLAIRIGFYAKIFVHIVMFTNQYIEVELTTTVF